MVKGTYCSCKRIRFSSQCFLGGSQPSVIPDPGYLIPSWELAGHRAFMWCTHIHTAKMLYIINIMWYLLYIKYIHSHSERHFKKLIVLSGCDGPCLRSQHLGSQERNTVMSVRPAELQRKSLSQNQEFFVIEGLHGVFLNS